jgi:hypothetical protein
MTWVIRRGVRAEWGSRRDRNGFRALLKANGGSERKAALDALGSGVPTMMMFTGVFVLAGWVFGLGLGLLVPDGSRFGVGFGTWPAVGMAVKYLRLLLFPGPRPLDALTRDRWDLALAAPVVIALSLTV